MHSSETKAEFRHVVDRNSLSQPLIVKKWSWELQGQGPFLNHQPEQATYLTPAPEVSKGHAVLTESDAIKTHIESGRIKEKAAMACICASPRGSKRRNEQLVVSVGRGGLADARYAE